jgi:putative transposase
MENLPKVAYRTLVLGYNLSQLPHELAEKVSALLKTQEEFKQWATEWVLSGGRSPLPERNPLKYFANRFLYAGRALDWFEGLKKSGIEVEKMQPPLVFNAQLRLEKERDVSRGVFVDIQKRVVKIRKWSSKRGNTIVLPLGENAIKWILERVVKEGGKLVLAAVWIGKSRKTNATKLHVALVFRREVASMETKRLLVVDFNALHNGISWAVVEGERMVSRGVLRPDVAKILHLQKVATRLDSACAESDEICDKATATRSHIWRLVRSWEDEAAKKLVRLAVQYRAAVVVDVPHDSSVRKLKKGNYAAEKKIFLNFGRIRRRLGGLAEWYGVPYREERLYSTMCPRCGRKMEELPNRRVKCQCGFETHRDEVPFYWAMKRFHELISFSNSSFSPAIAVGATGF